MVQEIEEKEIVKLELSNDPHIHTRSVLFDDDSDERKDKNKKQFITCKPAHLFIAFSDGSELLLYADKGYKFDGATIPFGIGKGNMKLQIPALFHDIMCDDKSLINWDRKLSSKIFKALLIQCGVNETVAQVMYLAVETFQKLLFWKWKNPNG